VSALKNHLNNELKYEKYRLKRHTQAAEYWAKKEVGPESDEASAHKKRCYECMEQHKANIKKIEDSLSFLGTFQFNGPAQVIEDVYNKLDQRIESLEERLAKLSEI
jgi:hypothetical protein